MAKTPSFDHLSNAERDVVGNPEDYEWDKPIHVPPAIREGKGQFSMRIDPAMHNELMMLAQGRGITFSELVRQALESLVVTPLSITESTSSPTFVAGQYRWQSSGEGATMMGTPTKGTSVDLTNPIYVTAGRS